MSGVISKLPSTHVTGATLIVVAGLVPATSIRMAQGHMIGMAGTSPAMTKWDH